MNVPQRWIVIPNWDGPTGFQHYKDRTPRWIKNYVELMADDAYLSLTYHQRGVLHGLWLEYATARRQIPDSTLTVSRRLGGRVTRETLDALNHAGFITYSASKPLAQPEHPASPDKRREENPPTPLRGTPEQRTPRRRSEPSDDVLRGSHQCPRCNLRAISASALTDHLELAHAFDTTPPPAPNHPDPVDLFTNDELTDLSTRLAAAQPEPEEDTWPFSA